MTTPPARLSRSSSACRGNLFEQLTSRAHTLQAILIGAVIEIPCAALLDRASNDVHNAEVIILAILHTPSILFMLIIISPLKPYVAPELLDSIWKIGAFLLQGMLIALVAFLILEWRGERGRRVIHG